eukprot:COSAG06_NODE_16470_length_999_cov_1.345556_2_plen_54_part_01
MWEVSPHGELDAISHSLLPGRSSQNVPVWLPEQTHSPNIPSHAASFSHAPQPLT